MSEQHREDTVEILLIACGLLGIRPAASATASWDVSDIQRHILRSWPIEGEARQQRALHWILDAVEAAEQRRPAAVGRALQNVLALSRSGPRPKTPDVEEPEEA